MPYRKWKECKQQPGTAGPGNMLGCCLIYFHFLWAIHPIRPVDNFFSFIVWGYFHLSLFSCQSVEGAQLSKTFHMGFPRM